MRTKAYIRVSTLEQASSDRASLDFQRERIISFARSQGETLHEDDFYIDTSSGARFEDRPALDRLRKGIRAGKVKCLLVWKQDRLSRTARDTLELLEEFKKHGVIYKSVTEPFDTSSPFSEAMRTIIAVFAQMERNNITERMITGRYTRVQRDGTNFGSEPPFGYATKDRRFVVVQDEAEIVKQTYDLYLKYRSQNKIVEHFRQNGIVARVKLDRRQIMRILSNIKYTGRMKVKDTVYEQKHPPIISIVTFNKVQEIRHGNFKGNMPKWTNIAPGHILRDVAVCGECGKQMTRCGIPSQKKTGGLLEYYRCATKTRKETRKICPSQKYHKKEALEGRVVEEIFRHIESLLSNEAYLKKHLNVTSQEEISVIKTQIESKIKTLQGKQKARGRWLEVFEKQDRSADEFIERYDKLGKEITSLEDDLARLRASLEREKAKKEDFKLKERIYRNFRSNWGEAETKEKREMINSLIRIIRVYRGRDVEIEYNF